MPLSAYHTQILLDALRCLALAAIATGGGWAIGAHLPRRLGLWAWAMIAAPLFTPTLLVTYTYAALGLRLTGASGWLTAFYSLLLTLKLVPLAVLARRFFPPAISAEGLFCEELLQARSLAGRAEFHLRALGPIPWIALGLTFVLAFTDFELASLLSMKTWAVMLFDMHAGGLELGESLRRVLLPLGIELVPLVALVFAARNAGNFASPANPVTRPSRWALPVAALVAAVMTLWPGVRIAWQSMTGWSVVGLRETMGEDVMTSLAMAVVSTGAIWLALAIWRRRTVQVVLAIPGLLGALVLSLLILGLVHAVPPAFLSSARLRNSWTLALAGVANSPLPLIFAKVLLLAPVAIFLRAMLAARRPGEALHLARMAGSRRLIWELALEPGAAALGLVFVLSYFEFTAGSILAPVALTPVCVRLHNLAHYGQTAALSAMLLASTFAPAALLALTLGGARLYARQDAR
jgi:hypothetical protein